MMVAIEMITYNHCAFIRRAIESIIRQEADFEYRLYVFDDCSTDGTTEICRELANRHPEKIYLHSNEKNLGISGNARLMHEYVFRTKPKYIAMCDGDDYWLTADKLQKQVTFLEQNPDYSIAAHAVLEVDRLGEPFSNSIQEHTTATARRTTFTIEDLAEGNFLASTSVLYRRNVPTLPEWIYLCPAGDYAINMLNASYGKIHYSNEVMAAYTVGVGTWSTAASIRRIADTLVNLRLLTLFFKDQPVVLQKLENSYQELLQNIAPTLAGNLEPVVAKNFMTFGFLLKTFGHKSVGFLKRQLAQKVKSYKI